MNSIKIEQQKNNDLCIQCEDFDYIIQNCLYLSLFNNQKSQLTSRKSDQIMNFDVSLILELNELTDEMTDESKN